MSAEDESDECGLYEKYEVFEDGEEVNGAFVLEPESDRAARVALQAYATATENDELSHDLQRWLTEIRTNEN